MNAIENNKVKIKSFGNALLAWKLYMKLKENGRQVSFSAKDKIYTLKWI